LIHHWPLLVPAAFATFLYTAAQLPQPVFKRLRKYAYGKTIFLALIWTYVTSILPLLLAKEPWTLDFTLYICSRYFFIYSICILFDERDREQDRLNGVKSLITYLSRNGIRRLFIFSWLAHIILTLFLLTGAVSIPNILILLTPALLLLLVYPRARRKPSDLLYYVVLDGLLALSALLLLLVRI
jgi:4-hydroxybenzoate polyprenyltransferase